MVSFSFRHSGLTVEYVQQYAKCLRKYWDVLRSISSHSQYDRAETSMNLCDDRQMVANVQKIAGQYQEKNPLVIVVGIGGSNLGTQAVYEALRGQTSDARRQKTGGTLLFADSVDRFKLRRIIDEVKFIRRQKRTVVLNIISKSGGTTETVMNAEYLKKYAGPFSKEDIVVTTDEHSQLWELSIKLGYHLLPIPKIVGGRYSVFTAVGLFPLSIAHIDVTAMLSGARWALKQCLGSLSASPAVRSASALYYHATHGRAINDNFFFRTDLESLGKWYRQLMGESIGKDGKGMTPTVSIGSTDLHSIGQLYLGGPQDKVTTFVSVASRHQDDEYRLPSHTTIGPLVGGVIDGRSTDEVLDAILQGTKTAYARKKHPFMEVTFSELNEFNLGAFMQWKMIEMMMLGKLLRVNAFDQPNVEEYKVVTKKLLQK